MLVYRTIAKIVFWDFDFIIMQNFSDILPLFCTPAWPSHHVSENQEFKVLLVPSVRLGTLWCVLCILENGLNPGVIYLDGLWSSGGKDSSEGPLIVTDDSKSWVEVIIIRDAPVTPRHLHYHSYYSSIYQSQYRPEHLYIRLKFQPSLYFSRDV